MTYSRIDDGNGKPYGVYNHAVEVTESVFSREAIRTQKEALELTLKEAPLESILDLLAKLAESQAGGRTLVSILLLDADGKRLLYGAGPHLPDAYNKAIHGIEIGPTVGSCGTASFHAKTVIVSDIATDPLWAAYRDLAAGIERFKPQFVSASLSPPSFVHRKNVEEADEMVRVVVEDHGIGIAEGARDKIFDRFERAVNANEVSGLGLGLFISKQIVTAHQGRIWVESELGKGSKFIVELPKDSSL